ncbi:MAG TPA: DNA polymerase/3'-5' exonuclease PolX [Steroidobacteraceae bacterium]|nr:DNA polymerase/3'-5' exonuclease PolX [Steroidobacteraceae bacterium]
MSIHNADIADAFDELGDLLSLQGENPFRIRAYRRAARVVRSLPQELAELKTVSDYDAIPGIGRDLAAKIAELVKSGRLKALEKLRREVPPGVRDLLSLPGMGPVRVRSLMTTLHVKNREDLGRALAAGRIGLVRGFGEMLQSRLRDALAHTEGVAKRFPLRVAAEYAEPLRRYLAAVSGVERVEIAGSYRRGRETVGDLDVLASAPAGVDVCGALERYPDLRELLASGSTKASGVLRNGLQVDVRAVPPESFGAALLYFTGSKDHNIHLRRLAQQRDWKLSEYGLFRGSDRVAGETEEGVYRTLGLSWIAPELREDRGEVEAAMTGALPRLIERSDLRGDLHVHTDATDGHDSLETMVAAARTRNLSYIAITDHTQHIGIVHGLDVERLARQCDAIDALNAKVRDFVVLKGAEVDILEDGRLALPDGELARLDVVVIAVHSHFDLTPAKQTRRLLRALERPHVSILAHPTGRLIGEREPYALDFDRVLEAARERGCCLEVNGQPSRLDLDDIHVKAARDHHVLLSIGSDAHSADQLGNLNDGVRQARRGWARKTDVVNARPITELRKLLGRKLSAVSDARGPARAR